MNGTAGGADPSAPQRRVGLLGGTFDPPHVGHLIAAVWVRSALDLDEVRLVVANEPWQKAAERPVTPVEDRLAMAEATARDVPGVTVSDLDIRRGGPSYLLDTLADLRRSEPATRWFVILGRDAAAGLRTWHRWEELPDLAEFVLVERAGTPHGDLPTAFRFTSVAMPGLDLSSTALRARVAAGQPIDGAVVPAVSSLITERGLYRGDAV